MMSYWAKSPSGFHILDRSLEAPLNKQDEYITPNDRFFVCNSGTTPRIDPDEYRLRIEGDAVKRPLTLTYADLKSMKQRCVPALIECAGNHRQLFELVIGEKLNKRPKVTEVRWTLGGAGMAEWRGVPLRDVLSLAAIKPDAHHVCPIGGELDSREVEIKCPMPVEKALDADTLLALEMNGEPLPFDHGFPVRALVPGWIGAYSVKWVKSITVTSEHLWVNRNTEYYVLMGDNWPPEHYAPAKGAPITKQSLKSSLALEWPARLKAGRNVVHGFARSPDAPIFRVEWSDDEGRTWRQARMASPNVRYGWVRFEFEWDAAPGLRNLMTRATDLHDNIQPESIPFNSGGYLFNMVYRHPVEVS